MLGKVSGIALIACALVAANPHIDAATNLFVSATGACAGTGTAEDPFARLTDALSRVRELRAAGDAGTVIIHVTAGDYSVSHAPASCAIEPIPIKIDISDVAIWGATQLEIDPETGTPTAVLPDGSTFTALEPLVGGEALLLITPDPEGNSPHRVRVDGLALDGVGLAGHGFFVDRAKDFRIHGNSVRRFLNGVRTRAASGELQGNLLSDNHDTGMVLTAGSLVLPAVLRVIGNRACDNEIGFLLAGTGAFALVSPGAPPIATQFDPALDGDTIPNRLAVSMRNNVGCSNALAGVRFFGVGQLGNAYGLLNSGHYETFAVIDSQGDRFSGNGYGVSLDAGFPRRIPGNSYSTDIQARFVDDGFSDNLTANAFLGFVRLQVALGTASPAVWKPLDHSTLAIQADAEFLRSLNFSNPEVDSVTGSPLDNTLSVNGTVIANGSCVGACPDLAP